MSKRIPIRSLLASLDEHDSEVAHNVLVNFLDAMQASPKPVGITGLEMNDTELARYHDGWDAAVEMQTLLVCLYARARETRA
jgi:hypothetical protein